MNPQQDDPISKETWRQRAFMAMKLSQLGQRWGSFFNMLLDPYIVAFVLLTLYFMYLRQNVPQGTPLPPTIDVALTLVIGVLSGIVGAIVSARWAKVNEASVLVTRGKSAIRGLNLLLRNIESIQQCITRYDERLATNGSENGCTLARFTYEEIHSKCAALQEEVVNAIEEWQDIIPEVKDLKTNIGIITELLEIKSEQKKTIEDLRLQVEESKKGSSTDKEQIRTLNEKLERSEAQLTTIDRALKRAVNRTLAQQVDPKSLGNICTYLLETNKVWKTVNGDSLWAAEWLHQLADTISKQNDTKVQEIINVFHYPSPPKNKPVPQEANEPNKAANLESS